MICCCFSIFSIPLCANGKAATQTDTMGLCDE